MRSLIPALVFTACLSQAQLSFVRENYSKYEYRIPVRDGVQLFASAYIPKDVFSAGKTYPILLMRTPYSVAPYGPDRYRDNLGPSELFAKEKFIFVYEDIRGRYLSQGKFEQIRPYHPNKTSPQDTDESSDTYDTIDWLVKHVPGNTGKAGLWGISQPGFYAAAGLIDAHPALLAVSPQAPVTDYYLGDDVYHNGAFMLAANFSFYFGFRPRLGDPEPPAQTLPFDYGTPDGYEFYLNMGSLANSEEKYFKHANRLWTENLEHTTYDDYWRSRSMWTQFKSVQPHVMTVGGWFDAEDLQGPLRTFDMLERNSPPAVNMLVMGPWTHGGFARGDGDRVGNVNFGSKTALFFREHIELPFFLRELKGGGQPPPKAWIFETGTNQWRRFDSWPPKTSVPKILYLGESSRLSSTPGTAAAYDEYVSDPNRPVPYIGPVLMGMRFDYMTEDQRFASTRPDVLVYKTDPLDHDLTVMGPISVDLKVSTSGTDSDFVVKLIDVYPADFPDYNEPDPAPAAPPITPRAEPASKVRLGGYQQLVRGEPFRGKYRRGFDQPAPFEPGKPEHIRFRMPDVAHSFRSGHRVMIQIQSSWFPLTDRNPQKFMDIPKALSSDFVKATERVYRGQPDGSRISLQVLE